MPDPVSNSLPIFFILGRARSGTTLLRSMLDSHPGITIPPECAFVKFLYSRYKHKDFKVKSVQEHFIRDLKKQPAYSFLFLDENKLRNLFNTEKRTGSYADACRLVYRA